MKKIKCCKMCDNVISTKRIYCSNHCKFSDKDLNKRRSRQIKNDSKKTLECKLCSKKVNDVLNLGGHARTHLRDVHSIVVILNTHI